MIDRLGDRDAFRRLRSDGRRVRSGPLSVVVRLDDCRERPALAFAISRHVGPAVTRNRVRRRLREIFRELDRAGELRSGEYLVVVDPAAATLEYRSLRAHVISMNDRIVAR